MKTITSRCGSIVTTVILAVVAAVIAMAAAAEEVVTELAVIFYYVAKGMRLIWSYIVRIYARNNIYRKFPI